MEIFINKNYPIGIKEQIKKQILTLIDMGRLADGDKLTSASLLAQQLNINRNTVAIAYKELEQKNILHIIKGSGTFVNRVADIQKNIQLSTIFDQAYSQAIQSDFTPEEISNFFISGLLEKSEQKPSSGNAILIDCNYEVLKDLDTKIKQKCDIDSHFMLIQDIKALPAKFIKRARTYDFIICGMNHMDELKQVAPDICAQSMGFLIKTDYQLIHQIMALPTNTAIGYCCLTPKSARSFFQNIIRPKQSDTHPVFAGISQGDTITEMLDSSDIIFATHYAHETLIQNYPTPKKIVRVNLDIESDSFNFILSRICKGAQ